MTYTYHFPLTQNEKMIMSLRICYRAGYTGYFEQHVKEYAAKGLSCQEMLDGCIDDNMRQQLQKCLE
mgnify:CR=1 FL=1